MSATRSTRRRSSRIEAAAVGDDASTATAASSSSQVAKRVNRKRTRELEEKEQEEEDDGDGADEEDADEDEAEEDAVDDEGELIFEGRKDKNGEWISGTLTYADSKRIHYKGEFKNGVKNGAGEMFFPDGSSLKGQFVDDEISGLATYTGADSSRIVGTYVAGGVLEGEVVEYDDDGLEVFRGQYVDSQRHGQGTVTLPDGGKLVGEFVNGVFEGLNNKYVYPRALDQEASLRGKWVDGVMQKARFYLDDELIQPNVTYTFDESTATRISSQPLLPDPFEQRCVYVKMSTTPNSGEGLFALRPLPANTIVTFYSGTRDKGYKAERRKWSENSNTISLIDDDPNGADIDIDVSEAWSSTEKYNASLAHKCNHSFDPQKQNAKYDMCLHPRFGLIKSIRTLRPVPKDEELFVDYGYQLKLDPKTGALKGKSGPEWYRLAYTEHQQTKQQKPSSTFSSATATTSTTTSNKPAAAANKRKKLKQ